MFLQTIGKPVFLLFSVVLTCNLFAKPPYYYADAHLHYVDFFQKSQGIKKLIEQMDRHNISNAQFMGVGMVKKWAATEPKKPRFYMGDDAPAYWYSATDSLIAFTWLALEERYQKRLHPFISGFNPTDLNAVEHIELMIRLYPNVWQGIGEIFTRHDELTSITEGEKPRANHPALMRVYQLAAKYDLPVLLHSNITSIRETEEIYLSEFEEVLTKHPKTKFIWAHAGSSLAILRRQNLPNLMVRVEQMVKKYDNLYIDLSWALRDSHLLHKGKPKPAVDKLFKNYPTRFMIGSDMLGVFKNMGKEMKSYNPLLDALPQEVAQKVARDNFLSLLPKPVKAK